MVVTDPLQNWYAQLSPRKAALFVGVMIGLVGGLVGLLTTVAGPVIAFGAVFGLLAGLCILTSVQAALYGVIFVMILLPFGTLPVRIGFTPTFMDAALGAFLLVYGMQWMQGRRQAMQLTPVHSLIALYIMWLLLTFALGLRHAMPTSHILRQFAETLLSISMTFILVDLLREPLLLRRLVLVVMIAIGLQAAGALVLYVLPDATAENLLVRLARIGYPNGGVIRYIESNPDLAERAIGTWVDPNAFGGVLAVAAAMFAPQVFARKPVLRYRWLTFGVLGVVTLALILTFSRASALAFAAGIGLIAIARYRRYIPLLLFGALLLFLLPQTQQYIERFAQGFAGQDLATQMRIGEYTDALRLINRYPIFGVGFTGTPENDIYANVASLYLIMANQIGLAGVALFLTTMGAVFMYGVATYRRARANPDLEAIHLGYHAALLTALVNGAADLYFFRIDFQASIALFWLTTALALASSRLAQLTVDKSLQLR
ncbi:MAG: O-antigen ligase family protein [Chloroflexi bacterium]|nr:O-antigen ligase family protein [Chloroflexota bacterium]